MLVVLGPRLLTMAPSIMDKVRTVSIGFGLCGLFNKLIRRIVDRLYKFANYKMEREEHVNL